MDSTLGQDEKVVNINSFIISLVIFLNIYQIAIGWLFKIGFNMIYLEYAMVLFMLIRNKFKFPRGRAKIFYYIYFMVIYFALTYFFANNNMLSYYFEQFVAFGLILLIVFLFKFDFKHLYKYIILHSYLTVALYTVILLLKKVNLSADYMTWGYNITLGYSFLLVGALLNKKYWKLFYLAPIGLSIFINGSKGSIIVISLTVLLCLYHSIKNLLIKIVLTAGLVAISLNAVSILRLIISKLYSLGFVDSSYSLVGIYRALTINDFSLLLSGRDDIYEKSITSIKAHPFGSGIAKFNDLYDFYPHNVFLDIFVTFGVIIGSIFLVFLIYEFVTGYKAIIEQSQLIIFIVVMGNFSRLFVSKTFISDPIFWLMVSVTVAIKFLRVKEVAAEDNNLRLSDKKRSRRKIVWTRGAKTNQTN